MPRYTFIGSDGEMIVRDWAMSEYGAHVRDGEYVECGKTYTRDMGADMRDQLTTAGARWPMYSDAFGVHPDQVQEATAHAISVGAPLDFTPDGTAIFTSKRHREKVLRAHGYVDKGKH